MKKIVAAVVYGIALVSLVMGVFSLFVSMLTRCVYPDLSIGRSLSEGQRTHMLVLLILSFVFAAAFAVLAICQLFLQKPATRQQLRMGMYAMAFVLFANLIWALAAAFSQRNESLGAGDVYYDQFIFFLEALTLVLQVFLSALFLIVAEHFLHKLSGDAADGYPVQNIPQNNIPQNNILQNNIPQNNIPQNNIPQNNIPQNNIPQNNIPQNNIPLQKARKQNAPAPTVCQPAPFEDLSQLQKLRDANLITPEEFENRKNQQMYDNAAATLELQWQLYCNGPITEEEYQQLKKKILNLK